MPGQYPGISQMTRAALEAKHALAERELEKWKQFIESPDILALWKSDRNAWLKSLNDYCLMYCPPGRRRERFMALAMDCEGMRRQGIEVTDARPLQIIVPREMPHEQISPPAISEHDTDAGSTGAHDGAKSGA